ncbi:MAG: M28 family peptidase [Bacteroidota bacterium]
MKHIITFGLILSTTLPALGQDAKNPEITAHEVYKHIKYLASDELEGRRSGSKGAQLAAEYIASEFKHYGLKPLGDSGTYFQKFDFVSGVRLGSKNTLAVTAGRKKQTFHANKDFLPLGFSSTTMYQGPVVFAGYGISASANGYDDYQNLDVKDKAVLILRYSPSSDSSQSPLNQFASLRYKVSKAKELGAKAVLIATGPADSDVDNLMKLNYDQNYGNAGIAVVNLTRACTDMLLKGSKTTAKAVQEAINKNRTPKSFALEGVTIALETSVDEIHEQTDNVVGMLAGGDDQLKNDAVVVGAHYDHLGYGGEGSLIPDTTAIHNGADDNASGTAGVLELAQFYASQKNLLKRSLVFICFSGEELGLLGSGYYVKNPTFPLERTVTMINMDEIGRLRNRKLIVYGMGTSPGFESLVTSHNRDSMFVLKLLKDGFGPSDHSSFYSKKIPVFHFFTDLHEDYHRPSDDYDKINSDGEEKILRFIASIGLEIDTTAQRPVYAQVEAPRPMGGGDRGGVRSYTGTIPDFGEQVEGMKLAGVREGSPAAKAGLQAGDIIVKFGKVEVKNIYDYTFALGEYKPGDEVEVVAKRGKEMVTVKVKLERRN